MVNLTQREQDLMAVLMQKISSFVYAVERTIPNDQWPSVAEKLAEEIMGWALSASVKSQELGRLYDKFHRTGRNAEKVLEWKQTKDGDWKAYGFCIVSGYAGRFSLYRTERGECVGDPWRVGTLYECQERAEDLVRLSPT